MPPETKVGQAAVVSNRPQKKQANQLKQNKIKVDWSSGAPELSSPDGEFTFTPLGRVQYDVST